MIKSDTIGKLVDALTKAQVEFAPILKTSENPGFKRDGKNSKYADLATTIEATRPALVKNGLVVTQFPINTDTRIGVLSILAHISGEYIGQEFTLPIAQQNAQVGVAGVTYARRSSYQAIVGAAADDDDGNTAAGRKVEEVAETAKGKLDVETEFPKDSATAAVGNPVIASGGPLPTPEQLEQYTTRLKALREKLQTEGNLKPSPGLSTPRKILNYVLKVTGAEDLKQISVIQFDAFFAYAEKMDPVALVKLINQGGK